MTTFEVTNTDRAENSEKETFTVKLKGESGDLKFTLTIKSEFKSSIEKIVPMIIGERRDIKICDPNRKLDEFHDKHSMEPIHTDESTSIDEITKPLEFNPEDEL